MKLTAEDKALLRQMGYPDKDFPQIESAMQARCTKYRLGSEAISRDRAIALLGRQKYLSGLARSAFHYTAARTVGEDEESGVVYFSSSRLFKQETDRMTDRILFKARAGENGIDVRTYAPRMMSPHSFYIFYEELYRLESADCILTNDIHSFAKIRIDRKHDRACFEITWLSGRCGGRVEGYEQHVYLRWSRFREFLDACRDPDGPKEFKAVSLGPRRDRPRLAFVGGRKNLKAAIADRRVRHKLAKALMANFNYPDADEIRVADDFVPYSFFFREFRDGRPLMCGGLILHGQEDMAKAYYSIHT